ncbi:MAG: SGNH/GDSL hydrolase family protein [Rubripirellula sp.]
MKLILNLLLLAAFVPALPLQAAEPAFPVHAKRVLFLGDSITHAGHYITLIETHLRLTMDGSTPELINLGLSSETCSGLSEPEHPFPRPNVHERIDRALAKLKPDVVVACYGMNDGIYYPLSEERFAEYRKGIQKIIQKVHASGAKLVLMTPPSFDALPLKKQGKLLPDGEDVYSWKAIYEDYDGVMRSYADWVLTQADKVEMVIDLHTAVTNYVTAKRKGNPDFSMSNDGVHVNHEGHEVLADAILAAWGFPEARESSPALIELVSKQQALMHNAWLSEVGHKRPGIKAGLPIAEAKAKSKEMETQIQALKVLH